MKRLILAALVMWVAGVKTKAAEEKFSQTVRPEDFAAAGLTKLSVEERGRLDALIEAYKSGALEASRREAEVAAKARADAEARASRAEKARAEAEKLANKAEKVAEEAKAEATKTKKADAGFLAKAKVLLTPGTEVEYLAVESRIVGAFTGWEPKTVFTLENGQRWQIANNDSYYTPQIVGPKIVITPAALGGFWMSVPEIKQRVRVRLLGGK